MAKGTTAEIAARHLLSEAAIRPKVNPFSWMVEDICGVTMVDLPDDPMRELRPAIVRIALVSMPSFPYQITPLSSLVSPHKPPAGVDPQTYARALVEIKRDDARAMLQAFSDALDVALSTKPHIICFNELGLPTAQMVPMKEAKDLAWQKSKEHEVMIIAGSAHDKRTLYNTGYIFRPGGPREGQTFHKMVSARSVGELVSAPASRRVVAVSYAGLRIAVMICLDIADYASIASVVKVADGLDMLLVPCYTPKFDDMVSIAKVTSSALPGIVAMVNANLPSASAKPCQVARFGTLESPKKTPKTKTKPQAIISTLEITMKQFQKTRLEMKTSTTRTEIEALFGRRDMPMAMK